MTCCPQLLKASEVVTPCECEGPGFCPIIGCTLNDYGFKLCRSHPGYHDLWKNNGNAPCVGLGEGGPAVIVFGLGDLVALMIRVSTLGKIKPCMTCKSRMAWLNSKVTIWRRRAR